MNSFTFGPYIFPMNPTSYSHPGAKPMDISYAIDGSLIVGTALYNQNEITLTWDNVINDINGIVFYLKNFIRKEAERNENNKGPLMFNDHMGIYHGYATLIKSTMSTKKIGPAIAYTFTLTFRLN